MMKDSGVIVACGKNFRLHQAAHFFFASLLVLIAGSYKTALPDKNSTASSNSGEFEATNQLSPGSVHPTVLVEGLSFPWEILWGPDDHIWMTERGGRIDGKLLLTTSGTLSLSGGNLMMLTVRSLQQKRSYKTSLEG